MPTSTDTTPPMLFAKLLQMELNRANWTQADLMRQMSFVRKEPYTSAAISGWCTGKNIPESAAFKWICKFLIKCSPREVADLIGLPDSYQTHREEDSETVVHLTPPNAMVEHGLTNTIGIRVVCAESRFQELQELWGELCYQHLDEIVETLHRAGFPYARVDNGV